MKTKASAIAEAFRVLRKKNEAALIVYATAGFPTLAGSFNRIREIIRSGADMVEIGVPFSDPVADGPVIQHASQQALRKGATLKKIVRAIRGLRPAKPLILMSYLNPVLAYGAEKLLRDLKGSGVAGLVVPDLPVSEAGQISGPCRKYGVDLIHIIAPTTPPRTVKLIGRKTRGFIYCASLSGTTGERRRLPGDVAGYLERTRRITDKPVCVGFGVSTPGQARSLSGWCDGVIVGSRIVKAVRRNEDIGKLVAAFKAGTRREEKC